MKTVKKKIRDYEYRCEQFESVLELAQVNQKRVVTEGWKDYQLKENQINEDWHGVSSSKEAYELLSNGWQEGVDKINEYVNKVAKTGYRSKVSFENAVVGFTPCVPLALMNVPNCMIGMKKENVKSKVINIVYDTGASAGVSSSSMLDAGKNLIQAIINLEMNGYRIELKVADFYCIGHKYDFTLTTVKNANQSLNLKKLMFPIAHSAWLRVIGFQWQDRSPMCADNVDGGRGTPFYNSNGTKEDLKELLGNNTVYLNYKDTRQGVEYITKIIKG